MSLTQARTLAELEGSLGSLAHQPRFDIACDLEERGRAYFYDAAHQCAYYLCGQDADVLVWTWNPVETWWEAAILRSLIEGLNEPLNEATALEFRSRAINRRPDWLIAPRQNRRATTANSFHAYVLLFRRHLRGRIGGHLVQPVLPAGEAASGG